VRAGLSPEQVWSLSWFEFHAVAKSVSDTEIHDFNVMRHGASLGLMAHIDKKHRKQIMPDKLFPLPTDVPVEATPISDDEARLMVEQMTRRLIKYEEVDEWQP
jgi:hypothetical protein